VPRPSPTTLRTFAVAGRLASFRDAAAELHVTPSAVSHQIRALEQWVGAPLFRRSTRQVELTPLGAGLSEAIGKAFAEIDGALDRAREDSTDNRLRVSALPLFSNTWLVARLAAFERRWPGLTIELETVNDVVDLAAGEADVAIRNAPTSSSALARRKLVDLQAVPLCTPAIAARIAAPTDLVRFTLIEHSARPDGWRSWFTAMGHKGLEPRKTLRVDNLPSAISAAVEGVGVMIGLAPFIWEAPGVDRLENPVAGPLVAAGSYSVVYARRDEHRRVVRAFVDWIFAEMKADLRRLQSLGRRTEEGRGREVPRASR
jgi:LysR family glycine cleavage system transcriptional activator